MLRTMKRKLCVNFKSNFTRIIHIQAKDIYNHHDTIWYDIMGLLTDIEINQVIMFFVEKYLYVQDMRMQLVVEVTQTNYQRFVKRKTEKQSVLYNFHFFFRNTNKNQMISDHAV